MKPQSATTWSIQKEMPKENIKPADTLAKSEAALTGFETV